MWLLLAAGVLMGVLRWLLPIFPGMKELGIALLMGGFVLLSDWWRKKLPILYYSSLAMSAYFMGEIGMAIHYFVGRWPDVETATQCCVVCLFVGGIGMMFANFVRPSPYNTPSTPPPSTPNT